MTSTYAPYYERSEVSIYHGDCRDVLTSFAAETFDGVITDPPYLVNYRGRFDAKCAAIVGDGDAGWVRPAFAEIFRVMKIDSFCMSFYGWPHSDIFGSQR